MSNKQPLAERLRRTANAMGKCSCYAVDLCHIDAVLDAKAAVNVPPNHARLSDGRLYRIVAIQNDENGHPLNLVLGGEVS